MRDSNNMGVDEYKEIDLKVKKLANLTVFA